MTEPVLFGFPISLLFLYFILYAFLGWVMETCYCSILERRFVARGFLYGPLCPIYGVGVLMMICWFAPLTDNPLLFYVVATLCMSAWEYLVGWFLETTTHIKYWDYSHFRFNLHGRICLHISLTWGALAYIVIFWVHPFVAGLLALFPADTHHILAIVLLSLLVVDTAATIRELALVRRMMTLLNETGEELRLQLALGKAELSDYIEEARDSLEDRLDGVKAAISDRLDDAKDSLTEKLSIPSEAAEKLWIKYDELLAKAERASRHLRYVYRDLCSQKLSSSLSAVADAGRRYMAEHDKKRAAKRAARKEKKNKSD